MLSKKLCRCKTCGATIKGNQTRHLKLKHPKLFKQWSSERKYNKEGKSNRIGLDQDYRPRNQQVQRYLKELEEWKQEHYEELKDLEGRKLTSKRSWVRNYLVKVGSRRYECKLCSAILKMNEGQFYSMRRHVKFKHPETFKEEMKHFYENRPRDWVADYIIDIGNDRYECKLCSTVLTLRDRNLCNMRAHLKKKHTSTYAEEVKKNEPKSAVPDDDVVEYVVEYIDEDNDDDSINSDEILNAIRGINRDDKIDNSDEIKAKCEDDVAAEVTVETLEDPDMTP